MEINDKIEESIEEVRNISKDRNFEQTVDLIVNFRSIDLEDPENRFSKTAYLPNGRGKERTICVIADAKAPDAEDLDVNLITKEELEDLADNQDEVKKIAKENDYFLAEAPLMPTVGKIMGPVLGPRGKMPDPFSPGDDIEDIVQSSENSITLKLGEEPLIQLAIGTEDMEDQELIENAEELLDEIEGELPKGRQQIDSVYIKFTMSKPVRVI